MSNQKIVNKVYSIVAPLIEQMERMEDTDMIEFQLDEICEDLTDAQSEMLNEMLEANGII